MELRPRPKSKRLIVGIAAVIVAVVVVSSVLFVYYSPDYSWSSSIRDHDGDGVADKKDAYPYDPMRWGDASATVFVLIVNKLSYDLEYDLFIDSTKVRSERSVSGNGYATELLTPGWTTGPQWYTNDDLLSVNGYYSSNGEKYIRGMDSIIMSMSPGGTYMITLTMGS
jgi:hypothetical protein